MSRPLDRCPGGVRRSIGQSVAPCQKQNGTLRGTSWCVSGLWQDGTMQPTMWSGYTLCDIFTHGSVRGSLWGIGILQTA